MKLNSNIKGKMHQYFIRKIGAYDYRNSWMKSNCPYCGREKKFGINLSSNRCNCFRCGEHPSPIGLIMYLENIDSFQEALHILESGDYSGYVFKEEKVELKGKKEFFLPDGFRNISMGNSVLAKSARNYLKRRGFNIDELARKGWGYCNEGKYLGYIIIPFTEHGQLTYFNARLYMGAGPKYNNPEVDVTGLGKSFIIYNADALEIYKTVYICEGAINAETIGENGVATGGKSISRYQVNKFIKSPVEKFVILIDPDAKDKALNLAFKLVPFKKVKVVFLPDNEDVNSLGKRKTLEYVRKTTYQTYQELLTIKSELKL